MLTAEQISSRHKTLGASEIASVCGLNPWRSAHDVWLLKRGLVEEVGSTATRVGDLIEPIILQLYQEETSFDVAYFGTVVHPKLPWLSATPDFFVSGHRRVGEIKCVGWRSAGHWSAEEDGIPDYYRPQVEQQMAVTGADECDVAALIGGTDFRIYRIKRDPQLAEMLISVASKFWHDHVLTGVPPEADHSEGARRMLSALYPRNTKPLAQATPEAERTVESLIAVKRELVEIEKRKDGLENRLRELIADADGVKGPGFIATLKADKNGRRNLRVTPKEAA